MIYLDTGCLVKLYYPEPDSALVARRVQGHAIAFTSLHELEFMAALHQKQFRGQATDTQIRAAKSLVSADVQSGVLVSPEFDWGAACGRAVSLAETYTAGIGCRSLDILHCAIAQALAVQDFISTDARQCQLAAALGLPWTPL